MRLAQGILSMYRPRYVFALISGLHKNSKSFAGYYKWFFGTNNFNTVSVSSGQSLLLARLLYIVLAFWLVVGAGMVIEGVREHLAGGVSFGAAIIILSPILLGFIAPLVKYISDFIPNLYPKTLGKIIICRILEDQAVRLRNTHTFKVVAVAGSMGKTSTKLAIAHALELAGQKVCYQEGNYNDRLTVPLVLFGQPLPGLLNVVEWVRIFRANNRLIKTGYTYDYVVLELGTDGPGQIQKFSYLKPDITVLTGVAVEHMEYFGTLDAVAEEELEVLKFAKKTLLNVDDIPAQYLKGKRYISYGLNKDKAEYAVKSTDEDLSGQLIQCVYDGRVLVKQKIAFIGPQGRKIATAAFAVLHMLKIDTQHISNALAQLHPPAGRMQQLRGIKNSIILDDSYNAAPAAVEAALGVLSNAKASQKIVVLGSMNELGNFSAEAHRTVGASLNAKDIDVVVTIGEEAAKYLAPAALENNNTVVSFLNPKKAGDYVKGKLKKDAVVLVKGSQNGVFSEEAIKPLLANKEDQNKLVRQSKHWMSRKKIILSL